MNETTVDRYAGSKAMQARARRVLAGGVSSNFRYHAIPAPLVIERGEGPCIWDIDGNRYVDYVLGNGPAILGHTPRAVSDAVAATLTRGQAFTSVHRAEVELAERMCELVPCAELVRFDVSGTQVDQIAIRLARAFTGRTKVVKFEGHYHGWADNILFSVGPALNEAGPRDHPVATPHSKGQREGLAADLIVSPFNDLDALEALVAPVAEEIAVMVMEPVACNTGVIEPTPGYLEGVRALCDRHGIVLVFDEVITGFRVGLRGAQGRYGVTPDLAVFAKAIAGGYPLSMIAGRADIMSEVEKGVVHGGTYNGLTSTVAACRAAVECLAADDGAVYASMEATGRRLIDGLNALAKETGVPLLAQGPGSIFCTVFTDRDAIRDYRDYKQTDEPMRLRFVEAIQDRGVRTTARGTWFMSTVHDDSHIDETLAAARGALEAIR